MSNDQISSIEKKVFLFSFLMMASFMALMGVAAWRYGVQLPGCVEGMEPFDTGKVVQRSEKDFEVHLVAKMWAFDPPVINLPKGARVRLYLAAKDVTHGLHIENTNVNLMAVPGVVNYAEFVTRESGALRVVCHEYCGTGHQNMAGVINVTDEMPSELVPGAALAQSSGPGAEHVKTYGCVACHTSDGTPGVGPTFKGLLGKTGELADGTRQVADEAYLSESVRNPNAKIVKGFAPSMPQLPVSEQHLAEIIEYLKTLK